jgi:hypothetical protein
MEEWVTLNVPMDETGNIDFLHEEIGTIEGKLETLTVRGSRKFNIWDRVTDRRVECSFPKDMLQEAIAAFAQRVAVHGRVRYSASGDPIRIAVEELRRLRSQEELPQAKDLEGIDLAGGEDPVDYVRRLRSG